MDRTRKETLFGSYGWRHQSGDISLFCAPRLERAKLHKLEDILTIARCAVLCGAETGVDIADFGRTKEAWLADVDDLSKLLAWYKRYVFGRRAEQLDPSALVRFEDSGANVEEFQQDTLVAPSPPNGADTIGVTRDHRTCLSRLLGIVIPPSPNRRAEQISLFFPSGAGQLLIVLF